ncbi:MAG: TATA-box-binding protein [Candidatus Thermoplasmatota archaeon]|nr:TATA-box-binding protein [Candidatus Thermoplasmatota archaeon]
MAEIRIQNIVASAKFSEKLDLDLIAQSLDKVEYEPEQFPGAVYRLSDPKTATLLFKSGRANCTGAKTIEDVHKTIDIIADLLKNLGISVNKDKDIVIQNIVATADLEGELNLNEVAVGLGLENVEYEPEQFPGLVYRLDDPKVALLLFSSGKMVCAGARNFEDISRAVEEIVNQLTSRGLLQK